METGTIIDTLKATQLFRSLPRGELHSLAKSLHPMTLTHGEILFREGDPGDHLFIIGEGNLEIIKAMDTPSERILSVHGPGACIGEMSLFALDGTRSASVRASGTVHVFQMNRHTFDHLLARQPKLAYEMVRVLSERMKSSENDAIRDLTEINQQLRHAYEDLKAAQTELVEKEKLERELQLARQIQMSVLPGRLPVIDGFDFAARIAPARSVGGDFYDFIPMGGGKIGIIVGDVTDKGMPAAIFMAQTYALLHAEASRAVTPQRALQRVNAHLLNMNAQGLFVTVLYGVLDPNNRLFSYARAGHDLPILYSPESGSSLLPKRNGQPLGILDKPELDQNAITIPPGGVLLLYTDGVTDETSPESERFGTLRLLATLDAVAGQPADEICGQIYQSLEQHKGGATQFDDETLIVVRADS